MDQEILKNRIIEAIKTVYDPEIPANIWDMGMIYEINISEDNSVKILMTVTAPNCPVADSLPVEVRETVEILDDVKSVWVELTFDPPWTPDLMSEEAKFDLGML
jgi:FeS assembly SUF system protein